MTVPPPVRSDGRPLSAERLEAAAEEGRRLAARGLATAGAPLPAGNPVEVLARSSIPRLRELGVVTEVVRARRGCLVVRTMPRVEGYAAEACALVQAWLGALPAALYGAAGTVAESSCGARGGRACMHTLMWQEPAGIRRLPLDPPSPAASEAPGAHRPAQSGGAAPAPSPGAANPTPIPIPAAHETLPVAPPPPAPPAPTGTGAFLAPLNGHGGQAAPPPLVVAPLPAPWPTRGFRDPSSPGDGQPADPSAAARRQVPEPDRDLDVGSSGSGHRRRWAWLRRRAWLLAVGLVAGCLGGFVAGHRAGTSYTATGVLVVQARGSTAATSSANGAQALATTYAALIPDDQAMLHRVAAELGLSTAAVAHSLAVQAESGTALVEIRFSAGDATTAVRGANDVVRLLSSANPPGRAIAPGSVAVVSAPTAAALSGTLHKYGLPLGVVGGLMVGLVAALVAERTDRRVDDLDALGSAADCSATMRPDGLTAAELARSLQRSGGDQVTVVPMRAEQHEAANELAWAVRETWPGAQFPGGAVAAGGGRPDVLVSPPFANEPQSMSAGSGQTVLVVGSGDRAVAVREAAERLRLLGRGPTWAVLVSPNRDRPDERAR